MNFVKKFGSDSLSESAQNLAFEYIFYKFLQAIINNRNSIENFKEIKSL